MDEADEAAVVPLPETRVAGNTASASRAMAERLCAHFGPIRAVRFLCRNKNPEYLTCIVEFHHGDHAAACAGALGTAVSALTSVALHFAPPEGFRCGQQFPPEHDACSCHPHW